MEIDTDKEPARFNHLIFQIILIIIFFISAPSFGQRKSDIGFYTGVSSYMGELNMYLPVYQPSIAIGPIYRYNFNMRHSVRAHAIYHELKGSDENFRGSEYIFQASFVDLGLNFEFNWWPYKTAFRKTVYSPYVTTGIGYAVNFLVSQGMSDSHINIPLGIGVKANMGKRLSGGIEISAKKTFNDAIDGQYNIGAEGLPAILGNNDWYTFAGIFLTYKIFEYREDCPTYDDLTQGRL